jgi:hypothetical protein
MAGSVGRLRLVPSGEAGGGSALAGGLVWEGALDGPGLALLLRSVLQQGSIACEVGGIPHRLKPNAVWYDAGSGTVLCEVAAPPLPLA